MWIRITTEGTKSLKRPYMDEPVEFASTGRAQVPSGVGERLCDEFDAIEPCDDQPSDSDTEQ